MPSPTQTIVATTAPSAATVASAASPASPAVPRTIRTPANQTRGRGAQGPSTGERGGCGRGRGQGRGRGRGRRQGQGQDAVIEPMSSIYSQRPYVPSDRAVQAGTARGRRRRQGGSVALLEIRHYQRTTGRLIPTRSFQRLVQEIAMELRPDGRWQSTALYCLQTVAEAQLVTWFEMLQIVAASGRRITIQQRDAETLGTLLGMNRPF